MVKIYYDDPGGITPKDVDRLPLWRKEKALRYKRERDRRNCAAVYFLLERAFAEHGLHLRDYPWRYGEHGKPFTDAPLKFSLSHADSLAVCAVSDFDVGVDIQTIGPYDEDLARYILNDREFALVQNSPRRAAEFYELWTVKEAIVKYLGTGMADAKTISLPEGCEIEVTERDGCMVAVCSQCKNSQGSCSFEPTPQKFQYIS